MRIYHPAVDVKRHSPHEAIKELLRISMRPSHTSRRILTTMSDAARRDSKIQQDVIDELQSESTIDVDAVEVRVKNGVVILTGRADGWGDLWMIETAARRIPGVRRLAVKLDVALPEPGVRTDEDIRRECEHTLGMTVPGANHAIKVMVSSGWVRLSGSVAWGYERRSAEDIVSRLPGVNGVNDEITVQPLVQREDA